LDGLSLPQYGLWLALRGLDILSDLCNQNPESEWDRLVRSPYHSLEFLVYLHHITTHLQTRDLILDAGGGPGRYTIELARRGYQVVLLDISEGELELAKTHIKSETADVQTRIKDIIGQEKRKG